jgi:hypothetical protein
MPKGLFTIRDDLTRMSVIEHAGRLTHGWLVSFPPLKKAMRRSRNPYSINQRFPVTARIISQKHEKSEYALRRRKENAYSAPVQYGSFLAA